MNLLQLKAKAAVALEHAIECGVDPEDVEVSIQIELKGEPPEAVCAREELELFYDNDGDASGCVLRGFQS